MRKLCCQIAVLAFLGTISSQALADSNSYGYEMALLDARDSNPQKVLTNKKIVPNSSAVREFEWILETLRNRSKTPLNTIVRTLVETWRIVQRRGYNVTLLEFSRDVSDFTNRAYTVMRNQKLDFDKIILKVLKDNYSSTK